MKLLNLTVQNVQRISSANIQLPSSGLILITGRNTQGKSSLLDALGWLFEGKGAISADPIRGGQDRALIEGKLSRPGENTAKLEGDAGPIIVKRTLTRGDGDTYSTRLTVQGTDYKTPQALLDGFLGTFTLDPLAFLALKPREQYDALRVFVKGVDFAALDREDDEDYKARTDVNRSITQAKARLSAMPHHKGLPDSPVDLNALMDKLTGAAKENANIEDQKRAREARAEQIRQMGEFVLQDRAKAAELRRQADVLDAQADATEREMDEKAAAFAALSPLPSLVDVSAVSDALREAQITNARIAENAARAEVISAIARDEFLAESYTEAMADRQKSRADAIAAANLPVEGLGFGKDVVLLDGHPLAQASLAQRLTVALGLAMAAHPEFEFVRVRDGNGCDETFLQTISDMADAKGFQVIMERVSAPDGWPCFVIENGEVASHLNAEAA